MPAAIAIPAIVGAAGAGASVVGAKMQSSAARDAAKTQADAAAAAAARMTETADKVNPTITAAADKAATGVTAAADTANLNLTDLMNAFAGYTQPYQQSGMDAVLQLAELMKPGGALNRDFAYSDFEKDPGYEFRMAEGQKALERSAAARGGALGGSAIKGSLRYGQDYASNEYQKAFDRFNATNDRTYARLSGLVGTGLTANSQFQAGTIPLASIMNSNTMGAAEYGGNIGYNAANATANNSMMAAKGAGDFQTAGANATAAGQVGSANAWAGGINGAVNAGTNALMLWQLMNGGGGTRTIPGSGDPASAVRPGEIK